MLERLVRRNVSLALHSIIVASDGLFGNISINQVLSLGQVFCSKLERLDFLQESMQRIIFMFLICYVNKKSIFLRPSQCFCVE